MEQLRQCSYPVIKTWKEIKEVPTSQTALDNLLFLSPLPQALPSVSLIHNNILYVPCLQGTGAMCKCLYHAVSMLLQSQQMHVLYCNSPRVPTLPQLRMNFRSIRREAVAMIFPFSGSAQEATVSVKAQQACTRGHAANLGDSKPPPSMTTIL